MADVPGFECNPGLAQTVQLIDRQQNRFLVVNRPKAGANLSREAARIVDGDTSTITSRELQLLR